MDTLKKSTIGFMWFIVALNTIAGIVVQLKILLSKDTTSFNPFKINLTANQTIFAYFGIICLVMMLISILTMSISTDIPYSPLEVLQNFPVPFIVLPMPVLILGIINGIKAPIGADKITIIIGSVIYLVMSVIDLCCVATVIYDAEE